MLHPTARRVLHTTGALLSITALAVTCAATASAAPKPPAKPSTATAQGLSIVLPGAPALGSQSVTASNAGSGDLDRQSTGNISVPGTAVLGVGVAAGTAVAKRNGVSYSCAGIVQPGGTISVGNSPATCGAKGSGAQGINIDLQALTGLSLPVSIGDVDLYFNAVTAYASQDATGTTGLGKAVNMRLVICPAVKTGSACPAKLIRIPILVSAAPNQNLLPAVLDAISDAKLGVVGTLLSTLLAPVLTVKSNVQTTTNGVFKVVGVQVGTTLGASVDLGVASVGPNV